MGRTPLTRPVDSGTSRRSGGAGRSGAADLEPAAKTCVRHPGRETLVSCGRCGRPFCPECLIHTPAGQRCYECAGVRRSAVQEAMAGALLKAFGAVAVGAAIGSVLGLFFMLFAALAAGSVAGQVLAPLVNRRTRRTVYALGLASIAAGALAGFVALGLVRFANSPLPLDAKIAFFLVGALQSWTYWAFVAIASLIARQRVR